jgi:hypothetical protein
MNKIVERGDPQLEEILPGVRQDHTGRLYQAGRTKNRESVTVPYKDDFEYRVEGNLDVAVYEDGKFLYNL